MNFICTYPYYDISLYNYLPPSCQIQLEEEEEDFEDILDILYQAELLQVFYLKEMCEERINEQIMQLYSQIIVNEDLKDCIQIASSKISTTDEVVGLMSLFSYVYFYLIHGCICEFLKNGKVSEEYINALKVALQQK